MAQLARTVLKRYAGVQTAKEVALMDDLDRRLSDTREMAMNRKPQYVGQDTQGHAGYGGEASKRAISVGDTYQRIYNIGQLPQDQPATQPSDPATPAAPAQGLSTIGKVAAIGALAAGTLGLGATAPAVVSAVGQATGISVSVNGDQLPSGQSTTVTQPSTDAGS